MQMEPILDWLLIGLASLIAGIFNLSVALKQFRELSKGLIFFQPWRSVGFYVWVLVQMLLPAIVFLLWVTEFFEVQPQLEFMLFLKAVGVGVGFTAFLNARTETGFLTIDIQSIYKNLSSFGFELIARQETLRTSRFRVSLEKELQHSYITLEEGLRNLRAYFQADLSLKLSERVTERQQLLDDIDRALKSDQSSEKIKVSIRLLLDDVRQNDVMPLLKRFCCNDGFLQDHIPHQFYGQTQQSKGRSHP